MKEYKSFQKVSCNTGFTDGYSLLTYEVVSLHVIWQIWTITIWSLPAFVFIFIDKENNQRKKDRINQELTKIIISQIPFPIWPRGLKWEEIPAWVIVISFDKNEDEIQ